MTGGLRGDVEELLRGEASASRSSGIAGLRRDEVDASLQRADALEHAVAEVGAGVDTLRRCRRRDFGEGTQARDDGARLGGVGRERGRVSGLHGRAEAGPFSHTRAAHAALPMTGGCTASLPVRSTSTGTFAMAASRIASAAEGRPFFGLVLW